MLKFKHKHRAIPFGEIEIITTIAAEVITRIGKEELEEMPSLIEKARRENEELLKRMLNARNGIKECPTKR